MTPTDLDILLVTLFTWSLKVRFSSSVTPRNLTVETFVRIVFRILMSNEFFWLEIIIYEVSLTFRKSRLVLSQSPLINSYQFPVYCGMNIVNVTVGLKTVVSSEK